MSRVDETENELTRGGWRGAVVDAIIAIGAGIFFAVVFWLPLVRGAGFVGGDIYNYYLPLKTFYSDGLKQNQLRLWHPGIGNGVPVLGESQTGALYPPNLVLYRLLDPHTAYHASFLLHYVFAFACTYGLARSVGFKPCAALVGAAIFVYGWFPPRACLEWAIVTGAWTPLLITMALAWLERGLPRYWIGLALAIGMQLLAGHFQLAFTSILGIGVLAVSWPVANGARTALARRAALLLAILAGFLLAAAQLFPAWELKNRSQRAEVGFAATVSYGRIPPRYLVQIVAPWLVYPAASSVLAEAGGDSNIVEAHFYFGMVGLLLATAGVLTVRPRRQELSWMLLAGVGLLLATGIESEALSGLPGFGYFRYPGRYGILTQLGVSMLAARGAERWLPRKPIAAFLVAAVLLVGLVCDFRWVAFRVTYVSMVRPPIFQLRERSEVFRRLTPTDRVLAPDGNTLALSGAATVPPYLGLGPAEYYAIWSRFPNVFDGQTKPTPEAMMTLRSLGVTHLLTLAPLPPGWPATLLWHGTDPFLHPRWGRRPNEPIYLYHLDDALGRAYMEVAGKPDPSARVEITEYLPERVRIACESATGGTLVLSDLAFPGWSVTVDDAPAGPTEDTLLRSVHVPAGSHQVVWRYRPRSLQAGAVVALATLVGLSVFSAALMRRKRD